MTRDEHEKASLIALPSLLAATTTNPDGNLAATVRVGEPGTLTYALGTHAPPSSPRLCWDWRIDGAEVAGFKYGMNHGFFDLRQGKTTRVDNPMACPSTLVAEAARTLITFSGATIIPDIPEFYQKYPELLRFIAAQQMPWRESKTLSGVIGEHIVMARQFAKGVWLVGAATNEQARELDVKLDFLPPGNYQATIVQDGEDDHYQKYRETHRVDKRQVRPADTLRLKLAPGGGACVILEESTAQ